MVVRMRSTRSHTGNRRSHHALRGKSHPTCSSCGSLKVNHTVCSSCGSYNGRKVVNKAKKALKKTEKKAK